MFMYQSISLEQAQFLLADFVTPLPCETISLEYALGQTLAEDITAPMDQPPFARSPLDGYALPAGEAEQYTVVGSVYAGEPCTLTLAPGQAVKVATGAMLPAGCDRVVKHEDTDRGHPVVTVHTLPGSGQNLCLQGEEYKAGETLLPAGLKLDAAALGVLAGAGLANLPVKARPRVALLITGDEVARPGEPLPDGKIYGSNGVYLSARLRELGVVPTAVRAVGDEPDRVARALTELLAESDVVISTGGVSAGERDAFHAALPMVEARGVFHRVMMKPGSPAMFSLVRGKPVLSLSGNPFAAAATFELLARPLLAALADDPALEPQRQSALLDTPFGKPGRRFLRATLTEGHVTLPAGHASSQLRSLVGCNCLAQLTGPTEAGAKITVWKL